MHQLIELSTYLKGLGFVDYWKAVSIALTGAFGVLGLATDFRNKHTKRITHWGWISLSGILVSTVCGIAAQVIESHDDARTAAGNSTRAVAMLDAIESMDRLTVPLLGATVDVDYSLDCTRERVSPCGTVNQEEDLLSKASLSFYFFADSAAAKRFIDGAWLTTTPDLEWIAERHARGTQTRNFGESGNADSLQVEIPDYVTRPSPLNSPSGKVMSLLDLPGTELIIVGSADQLSKIPISSITIRIADGRFIRLGPFQRIVILPTGPYASPPPPITAYVDTFPKQDLSSARSN